MGDRVGQAYGPTTEIGRDHEVAGVDYITVWKESKRLASLIVVPLIRSLAHKCTRNDALWLRIYWLKSASVT